MRFVVIDVETANPKLSSICQIGMVRFEDGMEVASCRFYVDPKDYFDGLNVAIHGIDEATVRGAPTFKEVTHILAEWLSGGIVASHTHFDRSAIGQACIAHGAELIECDWIDTARVARRTWQEFAKAGYGLASLASHFGFEFKHHDALEDARVAGRILLKAIEDSGLGIEDVRARSFSPLSKRSAITRQGDGDGALVGETIVFTGALTFPRVDAANLAATAGADVAQSVTKTTTMLVVGDQDIAKLNGKQKSSKHLKAETLISAGQMIRIVGESDFMALAAITE